MVANEFCTRSHPHEDMDRECELLTEIARLNNESVHLKAELAAARASVYAECARICRDLTWAEDISWWLKATKKEVSARSCIECAEAIDRAAATPTTSSKFSEFIRNASPEEKEVVYKRVMDAACDDQNKAIERAGKGEK
jgi:hypothetical protein